MLEQVQMQFIWGIRPLRLFLCPPAALCCQVRPEGPALIMAKSLTVTLTRDVAMSSTGQHEQGTPHSMFQYSVTRRPSAVTVCVFLCVSPYVFVRETARERQRLWLWFNYCMITFHQMGQRMSTMSVTVSRIRWNKVVWKPNRWNIVGCSICIIILSQPHCGWVIWWLKYTHQQQVNVKLEPQTKNNLFKLYLEVFLSAGSSCLWTWIPMKLIKARFLLHFTDISASFLPSMK